MPRHLLLCLAAGAALSLTACGSGAVTLQERTDTLSAKQLATAAEDALEQQVGSRPKITCPEELAREDDATTRCTLTGGDDEVEYGVTLTISETDGDLRIGVEVDDEPLD